MGRRYRSPLREEQAAATRERILDAAHALLKHTRPVDLAWSRVAEVASVSERTVHRHFPRPEDLFLALSDRLLGQLGRPPGAEGPTLREALTSVRRQLEMLEADPAIFRVWFAIPTRSRTSPREMFEDLVGSRLGDLPEPGRSAVYAVVDLLSSPYAWDVFHHNWDLDPELTFRATLVATRALIDAVVRDPMLLDPRGPDPIDLLEEP